MENCDEQGKVTLCQQGQDLAPVLEQLSTGVAQIALDGKWLLLNQKLCELVGFSRHELLRTTFHEFFRSASPSDDQQRRRLLAGEVSSYSIEHEVIGKDGRSVWLNSVFSLVRNRVTQQPQCLFVLFEDITSRKESEGAWLENEQRFRAMTDTVPTLMWTSGPDKLCNHFNKGWLQFTGRTLDQELGSGWTAGVHPEDLARCLDTYVTAFDKRQPFTMEYRLRNFEGEYCWVTDAGIPRRFPDGTFLGYVGCCLDISDKKDAENARKDLANRLIHAQETERTRIARELHDDVGQQLAILRIEMMRAGEPVSGSPDKRHPSVTELCDSVKIIADKISHMSHQLHSSELEFLGLKVAVQSACRQSAERYGIKIECICDEVPAKIDGIVSLCLFRVVQEALHNVTKHSGAANIEVRLKAAPDELTLAVIDDGHGFDVEQARLAAGLGLIGMRERIQLIGGHFEVSSEPGHGTRIRVRAPVISAAPVSGLSTFPT